MKSILFITFEYPTYTPFGGIAFYYKKVASILYDLGYSVTILTAIPNTIFIENKLTSNSGVNEVFLKSDNLYDFKIQVFNFLQNVNTTKFDFIESPEFGSLLFELVVTKEIYKYTKRISIRVHGTTILANAYNKKIKFISIWIAIVNAISNNRLLLKFSKFIYPEIYDIAKQNYRERELTRLVDSVSTPSSLMKDFVNEKWMPRSKSVVSFPNPSQFNPKIEIIPPPISDVLIISYINRAQRLKGFDLFESLASEFSDKLIMNKKLKFYCYGQLENNTHTQLNKNIEFKGHVSSSEINNIMNNSYLIIIPSRFESFSNVALEAISNGCLVLVSDMMGIADHIEHRKSGFIFKSGDYESFEKAFLDIISLTQDEIIDIKVNALLVAKNLSRNEDLFRFYQNELSY